MKMMNNATKIIIDLIMPSLPSVGLLSNQSEILLYFSFIYEAWAISIRNPDSEQILPNQPMPHRVLEHLDNPNIAK